VISRRWFAPAVAIGLTLGSGCSSEAKHSVSPPTVVSSTVAGPKTLVQTAAYDAALSTFATATNVAGFNSTVGGRGPFTVFAPNNDAFARLPRGRLAAMLAPAGKAELVRILGAHVVRGKLRAADLKTGTLRTLNGRSISVSVAGGTISLTDGRGDTVHIVRSDITASNGIIHVVDGVLLPAK
jgi:uncharacterized surface protein with fasciclin (FAS1) repeats